MLVQLYKFNTMANDNNSNPVLWQHRIMAIYLICTNKCCQATYSVTVQSRYWWETHLSYKH